jgi:trypsin-like peptidase
LPNHSYERRLQRSHKPAGAARIVSGLLLGMAAACGQAHGRDIAWGQVAPLERERPEASPLSRTRDVASVTREKSGTGFFVDDLGHLLTARHAADDCVRLVVAKEGRAVTAQVVALSPSVDLAIIKIARTIGLAAVFPDQVQAGRNDMVFASAYDRLQASRGMLANATVAGGPANEAGALVIDSDVSFGASGAPVLDGGGLVQGVVSRRIATGRVLAVGAGEAKIFLAANGVRFAQDDRSQLAGGGSRADRAASISARVICLQD